MKIGTISDLHIDVNSDETSPQEDYLGILAEAIQKHQLDVLLIAGDISNHAALSKRFVDSLKQITKKQVLYVPGNHDYWEKDAATKDTNAVLEFFKNQTACLIEKPYVINDDWAIVGHSAWYDYSYAAQVFTKEALVTGVYNGRTWQDKLNTDWKTDDLSLSKRFAKAIEADLEKVKDKNIIFMSHFVTYPNYGVKLPHPVFDYFNAFIGTSDLTDIFTKYRIKYNIMGHVHYRRTEVANGITQICACLGNKREWKTDDLWTEINETLQAFEI